MNDATKNALGVIERILVSEGADPKTAHAALHAGYQLGRIDGQLEVAGIAEKSLKPLVELAA